METVTVCLTDLNAIVELVLKNLGLNEKERTIVREVLMYAEMRGSDQGLIKIKERTVLPDADCTDLKVDVKSPSIATIDGGGHTGMLVLNEAVLAAEKLVAQTGIALVSTFNTRSSTGSISYYATKLAKSGMVAMVLAGSPKVMAMHGGVDPVFGTNPIAVAIPTTDEPLVLDMATAAVTWFSVINARNNNQELPEGTALDNQGNPTTDPVAAMQGALRSFGGAKGSGLALMFEMLSSVLGSASIVGDSKDNRGNTIIAINPDLVNEGFKQRASELVIRLKSSCPENPDQDIRLPGEKSTARANKCLKENSISIDAALHRHLLAMASTNT